MSVLNLRELRKKANISQKDLAEMFGLTQQAFSKWETGKAFPNAEQIKKLCIILKCSPNDIFGTKGVFEVVFEEWNN